MMPICCPVCATEFPLEAGVADADAKRLAAALAEIEPALARALFGYLRLHKPNKTALRTARALKLLREVLDLVESGEVRRDHQSRPTKPGMWAAAMEQMANTRDKLRLPLNGHGYLLEVVTGISEHALADAEKRADEDRRSGRHRGSASSPAIDPLSNALAYARSMVNMGVWDQAQHDTYVGDAQSKHGGAA